MRPPVFAIVGNPNCGKTTLFNALTGLKQKVGNYPGVTVEKHEGTAYSQHGHPLTVIDLPGAYSLAARSPDEAVLRDVLLGRRTDTPAPDRIICVVDAANLERSLYLVHQVLDLGRPTLLVLNMMDLAAKAGKRLRIGRLEHELGIPVIAAEAASGKGVIELKLAMSRAEPALPRHRWDVPASLAPAVAELQASLTDWDGKAPLTARAEALLLLTDTDHVRVAGSTPLHERTLDILKHWRERWLASATDASTTLIRSRQTEVARLAALAVESADAAGDVSHASRQRMGDRIDEILTHSVWGWFAFVAVMGAMFFSLFSLAEYPMNLIDAGMGALAETVKALLPPGDLRDLITDGALAGLGGIVVFLPQILILFFFIGLLESTGYMARAAVLMDRLMGKVGLNGKAFIPLLSSYACAIPGILATRTIEDRRDRLVTILVAPLMSCSARLPVYLLMIAALVPGDRVPAATKAGLMVLMYALGTLGALGFAWLFKRTLLRGEPAPMILELPAYQWPSFGAVARQMTERAWSFLAQAGTVILAISLILWALATYPKSSDGTPPEQHLATTYAGQIGRVLEPAIEPLGFDWRIGIGLVSSFAAREVFVSTMGVIFNAGSDDEEGTAQLLKGMHSARWPDGRTLFTPLVCFNLMVFYVFAMQCGSTLAVVYRETRSWRWPAFQTAYMTGTAWLVCFLVFNLGKAIGY